MMSQARRNREKRGEGLAGDLGAAAPFPLHFQIFANLCFSWIEKIVLK